MPGLQTCECDVSLDTTGTWAHQKQLHFFHTSTHWRNTKPLKNAQEQLMTTIQENSPSKDQTSQKTKPTVIHNDRSQSHTWQTIDRIGQKYLKLSKRVAQILNATRHF